jgi:hypothetical protein
MSRFPVRLTSRPSWVCVRTTRLPTVRFYAGAPDVSRTVPPPPLRMAASTLWRSKTYLGAKFRRLRARLGAPKAITAMAHMLARLVYRMLRYGDQYVDKGMNYYEEKYRDHQIRSIQKKAKELGLEVTLSPAA